MALTPPAPLAQRHLLDALLAGGHYEAGFALVHERLEQMTDPRFARVMALSIGATILLMAAFIALAMWALSLIPQFEWGWLNTVIEWIAGLGLVLSSNPKLLDAPGNVLLPSKDTGLPKDSVGNVTQIVTLDEDYLTERTALRRDLGL